MINVSEEVKKDVQTDMFSSLIKADTELIDNKHSGKFIGNLTNDVGYDYKFIKYCNIKFI